MLDDLSLTTRIVLLLAFFAIAAWAIIHDIISDDRTTYFRKEG
ncbi:MAG: hypothetical protein WA085_13330 [Sphingobium sp.]